MLNPVTGALPFEVNGHTFTLIFSANALCALEAKLNKSVASIVGMLGDFETIRVTDLRSLFWAGLQDHHPDLQMEHAGRLMDALGMTTVVMLIMRAITGAFPDAPGEDGGDRPLADGATHAGTGTIS